MFDELDPRRPVIGSLAIMTDGCWMWPSDFAHYVREYRVGVPEAFLDHGDALGWMMPEVDEDRLVEIDMQLSGHAPPGTGGG